MNNAASRFRKRLVHKLVLKKPVVFKSKADGLWWLAAIIYSLGVYLFLFGPLMRVNQLTCLTNRPPDCPDYVLPELEKNRGQLIYKLDLIGLAQKLHQNIPAAEKISIKPDWPGRLTVGIDWQSPIANLQIPASTSAVLIGNNGLIMNSVDQIDPRLPVITASAAAGLIVSDYLTDTSLLAALTIIKVLPSIDNQPVAQIEVISPLELRTVTQHQSRYLFTATKPIETQLHALQLILAQTTIDLPDPVYDLRYDRPAIKQTW